MAAAEDKSLQKTPERYVEPLARKKHSMPSFHLRNLEMKVILVTGPEPAPRRVGMEDGASFANARLGFRAVVTRLSCQILVYVFEEASRARRAEKKLGYIQWINRQAIACLGGVTRPSASFITSYGCRNALVPQSRKTSKCPPEVTAP
jgi:hypothetical protein